MGMYDDLRAGKLKGAGATQPAAPQGGTAPARDEFYEQAKRNYEAARPDIEAGKLRTVKSWADAEADLERIRTRNDPQPVDAAGDRKKANEAYFAERNKSVMGSGKQLVGPEGEVTTLRTATVGGENGEPGYIIPTYDPETKQVYDLEDPAQRAQAMKMVEPDIKSGKLQPYERWQDAEADLKDFYPRVIKSHEAAPDQPAAAIAPRRTMYDELREKNAGARPAATEEQAAMIHQAPDAGMVKPSWQSPVQMEQPNYSGVQQAMEQAQVVRPGMAGDIPPDNPQTTGPQLDQTMLAPRGVREAAIGPLQTGARIGIEALTTKGAGSALLRAAPKAGVLKKLATSAAGAFGGSLLAEPIDPSENPLATAGYSAAFTTFGDAVGLGVSTVRKARSAAAAGREARMVKGGREAIDQLGPGNLPTPGRLTTTGWVDYLENFAEKSIGGGRIVRLRNERAQAKALSDLRREVAKYVRGASREDIDQLIGDVVSGGNKAYRAAGQALYRELDGLYAQGVDARGVIKLRNAIVTEFKGKAQRADLEALVHSIDEVLGVPVSQRGIERGIMLDPDLRPRIYDPDKPGAWVIHNGGADQSMAPPGFEMDPTTQQMVPRGQAAAPDSAPVRIEGGSASPLEGQKKSFTVDPKTGEMIEAPIEPGAPGRIAAGRSDVTTPEGRPPVRYEQMRGGIVEGSPNARSRMTFAEMSSLREAMAAVGRSGNELMPGVRQGQAKRIVEAADNALETAGIELMGDPKAFEAWRNANAFWKELHGTFNDNVMLAIANARPDDLFNTIMRADSPQQIKRFHKMVFGGLGGSEESSAGVRRAARAALADPRSSEAQKALAKTRIAMSLEGEKAWAGFQGRYLMRLMQQADTGAGITLDAARADRAVSGKQLLSGWSAFGDDANKAVFPSARQRRNAQQFFRTLEIVQAGTGSDAGSRTIQFMQAGATIALIMRPGVYTGGQAFVVGAGPELLAKLMNNEQFIRWVTTAQNLKPGSEAATRAVAQIVAIAAKEGARATLPGGRRLAPMEPVPKAKEARETLGIANRRGGYR